MYVAYETFDQSALFCDKSNMATSDTHKKLRIENLGVICSSDQTDHKIICDLLKERWEFISQELDGGKIVFIAGAHGAKEGNLAKLAESCKSLINGVCMSFRFSNYIYVISMETFQQML